MILLDRSAPVPDEVLCGELDGLAWYRCGSKVRFPTRRVARWWRRWAERTHRVKFRVYRCQDCQGFHLTSRPRRWWEG